jgi:hypothetical protein
VEIPLIRFISKVIIFTQSSLRLHLANQVKFTCELFKYIPSSVGWAKVAQACSMAGSEEFYCVVIPIMTWCIASFSLSRALVLLLTMNLYVGNSCKNFFCLPRPPLKYRFGGKACDENNRVSERKIAVDALGFGWPSTHSCNAVSLPFAVLRTAYGSILHSSVAELTATSIACYALAVVYATAVPFSRLVLGVHSAADVHAGMLYGGLHLRLWLSYHNEIGAYMDQASVWFVIAVALLMVAAHPRVKPQNYTFEESVCIIAYTLGFIVGKYLADDHGGLNILCATDAPLWMRAARIAVGYAIVLPAKEIVKAATGFMRTPQFKDANGDKMIEKYSFEFGDFVSRMLQYAVGYGVGCTYFAPLAFEALGI